MVIIVELTDEDESNDCSEIAENERANNIARMRELELKHANAFRRNEMLRKLRAKLNDRLAELIAENRSIQSDIEKSEGAQEMLEKRYETQESENQAASGKLELERREVRQELIKKAMELDRTILALNESLQQNTELRNEIEQQQVRNAKISDRSTNSQRVPAKDEIFANRSTKSVAKNKKAVQSARKIRPTNRTSGRISKSASKAALQSSEQRKAIGYGDKTNSVGSGTPQNQKAYFCDVCSASFNKLSTMRKHRAVHAGQYKCAECNKGFRRATDAQSHRCVYKRGSKNPKVLEANAYDEANEEFIINEDMIVPYGDGVDE